MPFGAGHRQTSFQDPHSWRKRMRIEQRIEVICAPGQCFACKKLGHLKKYYPTRGTKDSAKEILEGSGTIGHEKPSSPRLDKAVIEWRMVGKTHVLRKTPQVTKSFISSKSQSI